MEIENPITVFKRALINVIALAELLICLLLIGLFVYLVMFVILKVLPLAAITRQGATWIRGLINAMKVHYVHSGKSN